MMLYQHRSRSLLDGLDGLHDDAMLLSCVHNLLDAPVPGRHRVLERVGVVHCTAGRLEREDGEVGQHIPDLFGFFFLHAQRLGDVCHRRRRSGGSSGFILEYRQPAYVPLHVIRNVYGAGLLGQGTGNGMADPPGHMGGDAEASAHIEFFNAPSEPDIASDSPGFRGKSLTY